MQPVTDITVPETRPATEFYFGRPAQKMSPQQPHARAQGRILAALLRWAEEFGSGEVGAEWEFHLAPPGEPMNIFVPDVVYLPYDRMRSDDEYAERIAYVAPAIAVEVLSPGNTRAEIEEKRRVFLACGTDVFAVADPDTRSLTVHDRSGTTALDETQTFGHLALPNFNLRVGEIFRAPARR